MERARVKEEQLKREISLRDQIRNEVALMEAKLVGLRAQRLLDEQELPSLEEDEEYSQSNEDFTEMDEDEHDSGKDEIGSFSD